jgi:hypothetical protein
MVENETMRAKPTLRRQTQPGAPTRPEERPWWYAAASLLLLVPCNWQPRIEASDLASHIYNCWLAQLIGRLRPAGLEVVHPSTNVLFDWLLSGFNRLAGPSAAQHLAVSLAVLTFAWGAFAFISVLSRRRPWSALPVVAMLAYGCVYHLGFFNFYLSMGLCLWALALAWSCRAKALAGAAVLLVAAYLAHALPLAWTLGLLGYRWLTLAVWPDHRKRVLAGALTAIAVLHFAVFAVLPCDWTITQFNLVTGADQLIVFDFKYTPLFVTLLGLWTLELIDLIRASGLRTLVRGLAFELFLISAVAVFLAPGGVLLPGYLHRLQFIPERMSMGAAMCVCAMLNAGPPRKGLRFAQGLLAAVFFAFLFHDESALNRLEERIRNLVDRLPAGQRVILGIDDPNLRINATAHLIDRACLGHCFSYANYEPSTWQFRVRATGPNPYVASTYEDSWELQSGMYVVRPADLPMYQVVMDAKGRLGVRELPAGKPCGITYWKALPDLF